MLQVLGIITLDEYCSSEGVSDIFYVIKVAFNILRILVPSLLIITAALSLAGMMLYPDEKKYKKKLINRVIAALVVFFIPTFVSMAIGLVASEPNQPSYNVANCWVKAESVHKTLKNQTYYDDTVEKNALKQECPTPISIEKNSNGEYEYAKTCELNPEDGKWYVCLDTEHNCFLGGKKGSGEAPSSSSSGGSTASANVRVREQGTNKLILDVPVISQSDPRWASHVLRDGNTLASAGCGYTSLAEVLSYLLNKSVNPADIADLDPLNENGERHIWKASTNYARQNGYEFQIAPNIFRFSDHSSAETLAFIKSNIDKGLPMVVAIPQNSAGRCGIAFDGGGGHYIAIIGYNGSGIALADPGNPQNGWNNKLASVEDLHKCGLAIHYIYTFKKL